MKDSDAPVVVAFPRQSIDGNTPKIQWTRRARGFRRLGMVARSFLVEVAAGSVERLASLTERDLKAERRQLRLDLEFMRGRAADALDLLRMGNDTPEIRAASQYAILEINRLQSMLRAIKAARLMQQCSPTPAA